LKHSNEFVQEQTRQILVKYRRVKASAAEPINIKYYYPEESVRNIT